MIEDNAHVNNFLENVELKKIAGTLIVPTSDRVVRNTLEELDLPVPEDEEPADRRTRLEMEMARMRQKGLLPAKYIQGAVDEADEGSMSESDEEEIWVAGPQELTGARKLIAQFSHERCTARLNDERAEYQRMLGNEAQFIENYKAKLAQDKAELANLDLYGSQIGFARGVSAVAFAATGQLVAGDWSGTICSVSCENLELGKTVNCQIGRIGGIAWSPSSECFAVGASDGSIALYSAHFAALQNLKAAGPVGKLTFHPFGNYLAAPSGNNWTLWDVERGQQLWDQTGHRKTVTAVRMHPDGALLLSASKDALAQVWDLRTGEPILALNQHAKEIYAAEMDPDGYHIYTGGADNSIFVWDLRKTGSACYEIAAHTNLVSDIKVFGRNKFVSCSYDMCVRAWVNWRMVATVSSTERLMALDVYDKTLIAGRWDRTVDKYIY